MKQISSCQAAGWRAKAGGIIRQGSREEADWGQEGKGMASGSTAISTPGV